MFELKAQGGSNEEWNALFIKDTVKKEAILNDISNGRAVKTEEPIPFYLFNNVADASQRRRLPFASDMIYWSDDITLNAYRPESGNYVIVSTRLKQLLSNFRLPDHKFSILEIVNFENHNERQFYYLLQLFGGLMQKVNFSESRYKLTDRKSRKVLSVLTGGYQTQADLNISRSQFLKEGRRLDFETMVLELDNNFQVLWGFNNSILVDDAVKQSIMSINLQGVTITEFNEFNIVLKVKS